MCVVDFVLPAIVFTSPHVNVLVYDAKSGRVFKDVDGGANGYDRALNYQRRAQTNVTQMRTLSFSEWKDTLVERE